MRTMVIADMLILKKYLPQQFAISLIVILVITFSIGNFYSIVPAFSFMMSFTLIFSLATIDERGNWQQFRLALPLSRRDVVVGRYATLLAIVLFGIAYGLVVMACVGMLAYALPNVTFLSSLMIDFSWQAVMLTTAVTFVLVCAILSILMPFATRFGMSNTVRLSPLIFFAAAFGFSTLGNNLVMPSFLVDLFIFIETPPGTLAATAASLVLAGILLTLSGALAIKLIENREF